MTSQHPHASNPGPDGSVDPEIPKIREKLDYLISLADGSQEAEDDVTVLTQMLREMAQALGLIESQQTQIERRLQALERQKADRKGKG